MNSKSNFEVDEQNTKDSLFKSYTYISDYLKKLISLEDITFSTKELFKLYLCQIISNIINEKLILFIFLNIIIFYSPIENKCEHFLFKIKMGVKQTFEGIIGLIIVFIPKYEARKEKEKRN